MHAIEVFADIWCPFAHAGLRAVVRRRAEFGREDVPLLIRAWPLELVNDAPQDVDEATEHMLDIKTHAAPQLFSGFDPDRFPTTTIPALALAAAAYRYTAPIGERVSLALRDALWEQGLDVSDHAVLDAIAADHAIDGWAPEDERSVREDWELGKLRGVKGSPHFFCGGVDAFCPSVDIDRSDDGSLEVRADPAKLDAFLATCLT